MSCVGTLVRAAGIGMEANTEQKLEDWREKSNPPPCGFPPAPVLPRRSIEIFEAHTAAAN
jgi:hypothetical protein